MQTLLFPIMRYLTLGFWLVALVSLLGVMPESVAQLIQIAALLIAVAHMGELVLFRKQIQQYESAAKAKLNIMIYGVFWALPNLKSA